MIVSYKDVICASSLVTWSHKISVCNSRHTV